MTTALIERDALDVAKNRHREGESDTIKLASVSVFKLAEGDDDPDGTFIAWVNTTGVKDAHYDVIVPGAWAEAIKTGPPPIGMWSHKLDTWIAKAVEVEEVMPGDKRLPEKIRKTKGAGAVRVKGQFNLDSAAGREAYANAQFFEDRVEWSVGFSYKWSDVTVDEEYDDDHNLVDITYFIEKVSKFYEFSMVYAGASPMTHIESLKGLLSPETAAAVDRELAARVKGGADTAVQPAAGEDTGAVDGSDAEIEVELEAGPAADAEVPAAKDAAEIVSTIEIVSLLSARMRAKVDGEDVVLVMDLESGTVTTEAGDSTDDSGDDEDDEDKSVDPADPEPGEPTADPQDDPGPEPDTTTAAADDDAMLMLAFEQERARLAVL